MKITTEYKIDYETVNIIHHNINNFIYQMPSLVGKKTTIEVRNKTFYSKIEEGYGILYDITYDIISDYLYECN